MMMQLKHPINFCDSLFKIFIHSILDLYNELGYNELGCDKHPVIINKLNSFGWWRSVQGIHMFPIITNKTRLKEAIFMFQLSLL